MENNINWLFNQWNCYFWYLWSIACWYMGNI